MNYDALRPGYIVRDFPLPGRPDHMLSDLRGAHHMLLLFGGAEMAALAAAAAARLVEFEENDVQLVLLLRGTAAPRLLPFPALHDDGTALAALSRQNAGQDPGWAALATDRFGEIFFSAVGSAGDPLPDAGELLKWAVYVGAHCPECHPPEWPPL